MISDEWTILSVRACRAIGVTSTFLAASAFGGLCDAQTLETETARLLPRGRVEVGGSFEYQTASEGRERAIPLIFEYGITDKLEIAFEPVPYTAIRPAVGPGATGPGDLEITLVQRLVREKTARPALALAAELKVPTARNKLIGTGKPDYTGYLILSKRFDSVDSHFNVGYTLPGSPFGTPLSGYMHAAAAIVYRPRTRTELFAEVLGQTASSEQNVENGDDATAAPVPEAGVPSSLRRPESADRLPQQRCCSRRSAMTTTLLC